MIYKRRLKVHWFLSILCTLIVSGTLLYKNIKLVNKYDRKIDFHYNNLPRKSLLSVRNTQNVSSSTETYLRKLATKNTKKHVTKSMKQLGKMDEISKHFLFFNAVPKSGSEILIFLLEKIQGANNFKHIRLNKDGQKKKLNKVQQENLINEIYDIKKTMAVPLSFDRNVYFINFTSFDKQSPTYVNLIRDPIAKIMSRAISPKTGQFDSYFLRCILDSKGMCNFKSGRPYDLTIPYFCGQDPRCMLLNNEWAFETAKRNVDQYYQVIGVLEELDTTLKMLEYKIPQFFKGAKDAYQQNLLEIYKNKSYPKIPENVRKKLEETLMKEIEFYNWVKQRLLNEAKYV